MTPAMCGALCPQLSCKWYSHVLWLLEQQDDLELMPGRQSSLLVGSDGTPPTDQWVGHIASCMVNRLRDVMVTEGLSVEEEEDTDTHCVDVPPWHAVARRATHLVEQWVGLGTSLPSTSMFLLRLCRRIPLLFACLSGLTHCACMFPNYSEPLYQLAQFCHRQGLDQVSSTSAHHTRLPLTPGHRHECRSAGSCLLDHSQRPSSRARTGPHHLCR